MKINWGTGIVIAFILFITFILYFVLKVQLNDNYDRELVVEDYYQQELKVQGNIEKSSNANALIDKIKIEKVSEGIQVSFPESFDYKTIKGKVSLYRPSNQKLDSEMQISLSSSHLLIPKSSLVGGLWDITIDWEYQGVSYRNKKSIYY
ncbi:FixH family protein [Flavobacterium sediminilitoris]|uniref:FixH family protein n=1 Tax=Flavobacterium sediminilitoris TaxID=2024526 RepID=A0ABY4HM10_9FLAO|nr:MULTISPECIES: FixH family protein [Flavobacterium]UOX33331.1 FixH family protein [Flavobacterium sediminilitoris]